MFFMSDNVREVFAPPDPATRASLNINLPKSIDFYGK
jgi:hypothetical protein